MFVARLARPDGSFRTWWREAVDSESCMDPALELILPEKAELSRLADDLLAPDVLPQLWTADSDPKVTVRHVMDYFRGGRTVQIPMEGYDDVRTIPRCGEAVIREAVERAVMRGTVWLANGPAAVWMDAIPYGVFDDNAVLYPKPELVGAQELVEEALPGAWRDGKANGIALAQALSQARGRTVPWGLVRESIRAGVESRWLEVAEDSGPVSCGYDNAGSLRLARPASDGKPPPLPPESVGGGAVLEGSQIQDLADLVPDLLAASAGNELRFHVRVALGEEASSEVHAALDEMLAKVAESLKTPGG